MGTCEGRKVNPFYKAVHCALAANIGLVSSVSIECQCVNPEVAGSNPALVNVSKMYPVSFPCGLLHDIYRKKLYPLMVHPLTASSQVVS